MWPLCTWFFYYLFIFPLVFLFGRSFLIPFFSFLWTTWLKPSLNLLFSFPPPLPPPYHWLILSFHFKKMHVISLGSWHTHLLFCFRAASQTEIWLCCYKIVSDMTSYHLNMAKIKILFLFFSHLPTLSFEKGMFSQIPLFYVQVLCLLSTTHRVQTSLSACTMKCEYRPYPWRKQMQVWPTNTCPDEYCCWDRFPCSLLCQWVLSLCIHRLCSVRHKPFVFAFQALRYRLCPFIIKGLTSAVGLQSASNSSLSHIHVSHRNTYLHTSYHAALRVTHKCCVKLLP